MDDPHLRGNLAERSQVRRRNLDGANAPSEQSFFTSQGHYKVDDEATPAMRNSLMYKMSYVRPLRTAARR